MQAQRYKINRQVQQYKIDDIIVDVVKKKQMWCAIYKITGTKRCCNIINWRSSKDSRNNTTRGKIMAQEYINRGCKGHYWTEALTREEMVATEEDIREYERLQG